MKMSKDKRTYEVDVFYLQNAGLKPYQEQSDFSSGAQLFLGRSNSDPEMAAGSFNRHTILRLIKTLKEK